MKPQYSRDDIQNIRESVDIRSLLQSCGGTIWVDTGENIRSSCVVHGGKNVSSLSYNCRTGMFHCFGECGFTGDVFALIQAVDGCSFRAAVDKAKGFSTFSSGPMTVAKKVDAWTKTMEDTYGDADRNEAIYSPLVEWSLKFKPNPYVSSGKYEQETIDYFEIGYCDFNEYFDGRAIITVHDDQGNLIGFSGRDMKNANVTNKYRIKKGFRKGACLYNLHRAKAHISRKTPLVICEGFGQVWRLHEAGVDSAVALMGKDATKEQLDLILRNTTSVILALDFDKPGVDATMKLVQELDDRVDIKIMTSKFGQHVDLGDMSAENARACYDNAIPAYLWVNTVYKTFVEEPKA